MTHVLRTTGLTCVPDAQIPHVANQLARWQGLGSQWMACRPSPFGTPSSWPLVFSDLHIFPSREEQPTEHLSGRIPTFVLKIGQACVCSYVVWPRGTCFVLCSGASCGHTDLGSRAPLYCSDPDLLVFVYVCERSVVPVDGGSSRTCVEGAGTLLTCGRLHGYHCFFLSPQKN